MSVDIKLLAYNSLWQLRNDTWSSLEESTTQLALAGAQQRSVEQFAETVTGLLDVLGSIERFWAFPGAQTYREVQRLFAAGKYDRSVRYEEHIVPLQTAFWKTLQRILDTHVETGTIGAGMR